jgi:hypothetical protein
MKLELKLLQGWADQLADIFLMAPSNQSVSERVLAIVGGKLPPADFDRLVRMVRRQLRS